MAYHRKNVKENVVFQKSIKRSIKQKIIFLAHNRLYMTNL